jgi:hypothetical protein
MLQTGIRCRARCHPENRQAYRRPDTDIRPIIAKSAFCPAFTVRRCLHAAKRKRWSSPRLAPGRTSRSSTSEGIYRSSVSCCTITSLPTRLANVVRMGSPGRREIGHGKLAWRAINPLLPKGRFPVHAARRIGNHGIERLVLDGDVCGTSLSMMDAGVPLAVLSPGLPWA